MKWKFSKDARYDLVGIGRNSWDRIARVPVYPPRNTKIDVLAVDNQAGGQGATTLVAAARLGLRTRYLGKFGDDAGGRAVRAALAREGVDLSECRVLPGVSNQSSFVVVDPKQHSRNVFAYSDARLKISPDDFPAEAILSGKILFLGGRDPEAVLPFANLARQSGTPVAVDADKVTEASEELIRMTDILFCSEVFPREFTGNASYSRSLEQLQGLGPSIVCVTLGEKGSRVRTENKQIAFGSYRVKALDTTGAGDVFHGAFLSAILTSRDIDRAIRFASAAAALKCRALGAQRGIPTRREVDHFLKTVPLAARR